MAIRDIQGGENTCVDYFDVHDKHRAARLLKVMYALDFLCGCPSCRPAFAGLATYFKSTRRLQLGRPVVEEMRRLHEQEHLLPHLELELNFRVELLQLRSHAVDPRLLPTFIHYRRQGRD